MITEATTTSWVLTTDLENWMEFYVKQSEVKLVESKVSECEFPSEKTARTKRSEGHMPSWGNS